MKTLFLAAALLAASFSSHADCFGTDIYRTCYDSRSGNSYTIHQTGSTTYINGHNDRTGSSWSETSQEVGNTTYHNGTAANGRSWHGTSQRVGNTIYDSGVNSRGEYYSGSRQVGE